MLLTTSVLTIDLSMVTAGDVALAVTLPVFAAFTTAPADVDVNATVPNAVAKSPAPKPLYQALAATAARKAKSGPLAVNGETSAARARARMLAPRANR